MTTPELTPDLPAGTFRPAPHRASHAAMALAQGVMETKLVLRHGEQQLLNLVMPIVILVAAVTMPVLGEDATVTEIFPMVLAVAATSAGFTGQAISLAFDRRYGALKRVGASGVPAATIVAGKIFAVLAVSLVQVIVLAGVAFLLGFRTSPAGVALGAGILLLGIVCFTSLGLLLGGTLSSELVLGLANLLWVAIVGVVGWVLFEFGLAAAGWWNLVPSVALAAGLDAAFSGHVPWLQAVVLTGWSAVVSLGCVRWFRFD
ncbi:ABC transporter permease [Corynebacterium uterequi]|uniref:ABC-2 family transporter protein n=1 Tax=Corynebacterium uterequi TaxID=1072256 RepID=A0A0G3HJ72_9CORY|nr:ABC transporter permease [Corynebacterium uterequi]AKK11152.1 ABC-2 family transporter protein [Corynebacterium uterequi]